LPLTVLEFAKPGAFDRNASVNPNVKQNRNLLNVLRNPGFVNALLASGQIFLEDYLIDDELMKRFLPLIPKIGFKNNN
jgi:hypothetical protein